MKKIIVLEKNILSNYIEIKYLFRLTVPATRVSLYQNDNATSMYSGTDEQDLLDLQDIKDGELLEVSGTKSFASGTSIAAIGSALVTKFNLKQTELDNDTKFKNYGTYWNGTTWTVVNNNGG